MGVGASRVMNNETLDKGRDRGCARIDAGSIFEQNIQWI